MALVNYINEDQAEPRVKAVFDDIKHTRQVETLNNFWLALANDPAALERTWSSLKAIMSPEGELDPLTKELIYVAVSITNGCDYCTVSHLAAARKAGLTAGQRNELLAIIGMANETNRLATGYQVDIDPALHSYASGL